MDEILQKTFQMRNINCIDENICIFIMGIPLFVPTDSTDNKSFVRR